MCFRLTLFCRPGGLYGDLAASKPADPPAVPVPVPQASACSDGSTSAVVEPAGSTISAPPTLNTAARVEPSKPAVWGAPKLMPQRRKRQQPSPAGRQAAAAAAAKKQKLLEAAGRLAVEPLAVARSQVNSVADAQEEYNPSRPHDYEKLFALRKKRKDIEQRLKQREDEECRQRRDREREDRDRGPASAQIQHIAVGRGRGRGATLPSWMTKSDSGRSEVPDAVPDAAAGPAALAAPELTVAEKMMAKMGYKAGSGLGRKQQGITSALQFRKTDRGAGVIQQAPVQIAQRSGPTQPSKVVLLLNMVGSGDVDGELEGEIAEECAKYGEVERVAIFEAANVPDQETVRIFVAFCAQESADKAKVDLDGRFFGGRTITSRFYDEAVFRDGKLAP